MRWSPTSTSSGCSRRGRSYATATHRSRASGRTQPSSRSPTSFSPSTRRRDLAEIPAGDIRRVVGIVSAVSRVDLGCIPAQVQQYLDCDRHRWHLDSDLNTGVVFFRSTPAAFAVLDDWCDHHETRLTHCETCPHCYQTWHDYPGRAVIATGGRRCRRRWRRTIRTTISTGSTKCSRRARWSTSNLPSPSSPRGSPSRSSRCSCCVGGGCCGGDGGGRHALIVRISRAARDAQSRRARRAPLRSSTWRLVGRHVERVASSDLQVRE